MAVYAFLDVGIAEVSVPFTMVDDSTGDGDSTLTISIVPGAAYVVGSPASAQIVVFDDETSADEIVWVGTEGDFKWETAGNWSPARVPTAMDTAKFTDTDPASGATITVDSDAACRMLKFTRLAAMTLDGSGSLKLGGITRADLEGTEGNHTISVPLRVYAVDDGKCVLDIAGSGALRFNGNIQKAGDVQLWKTGGGLVDFCCANNTWNGTIRIYEGSGTASANHSY